MYLFIYLSNLPDPAIYLSIYPSIYYLSVCPFVFLSICLSCFLAVCLCTYIYMREKSVRLAVRIGACWEGTTIDKQAKGWRQVQKSQVRTGSTSSGLLTPVVSEEKVSMACILMQVLRRQQDRGWIGVHPMRRNKLGATFRKLACAMLPLHWHDPCCTTQSDTSSFNFPASMSMP